MVRITWKPEGFLQVKGHAGSAEKGKDLVCAAVSTLVLTLAANTDRMARAGWVTEPVIRLGEGDALIRCDPQPDYRAAVELVFGSLCQGFCLLADKYPEYVKIDDAEE